MKSAKKEIKKENWEWVNPNKLKSDGSNPNHMTDKEKESLKANIERFGWNMPIIIDKNYIIADGEQKWEVAKDAKWPIVPVLVKESIKTSADRKIIRQAMNKLRGTHDEAKDALEFMTILQSEDMESFARLTGQSEQEILNIINKASQSEKVPEDNIEKVDKAYSHLITCPHCGKQFTKGDKKEE